MDDNIFTFKILCIKLKQASTKDIWDSNLHDTNIKDIWYGNLHNINITMSSTFCNINLISGKIGWIQIVGRGVNGWRNCYL